MVEKNKDQELVRDKGSRKDDDVPPIAKANIISRLFFWWLMPLFRKGYSTDLQVDDLHKVTKENSASYLATKVESAWYKELEKSKLQSRQPSLFRALVAVFGARFLFYVFLGLVDASLSVVEPILLVRIISYFAIIPAISSREAYIYCAVFGLIIVVRVTFIFHQYHHGGFVTGMRLRIAATALVFRKALRLNGVAMGKTTKGQMVNILSNDVKRFDHAVIYLPYLLLAPVQLGVIVWLLWAELGSYALLVLVLFCLLCPLQIYSGKIFATLRSKTAAFTDERVRIMNEIISGMRVVKIYTWEKPFAELVTIARRNEVKKILHSSYIRSLISSSIFSITGMVTAITFVTYSLTGHMLSSSAVYLAIPFFNVLRGTIGLLLPTAIMNVMEAVISVKRIQTFLQLEEFELDTTSDTADATMCQHGGYINPTMGNDENHESKTTESNPGRGIIVKNLTSSWEIEDERTNVLEDLSFSVVPGDLLAVIGPVGAGKSSLLMALLGEMPKQTGTVSLNGKIGYTAQIPWVFSGTLRNNILFGQPFEKSRYESVIKYCALEQDLKQLPQSDLTLVGERGVTLSGGQRARVGLARAVYSNADVYLLDDPLSAVDTSVGKHLFEKCICGVLADKTRILVTHQLQYLHSADKILLLNKGKAVIGTYTELEESGIDFTSLLKERENLEKEDDTRRTLERSNSTVSQSSTLSLAPEVGDEDIGQVSGEEKAIGRIGIKAYVRLFRAGASITFLIFFVIMNIVAQASVISADWWLTRWTSAEEKAYFFQDMMNDSYTTVLPTPSSSEVDSVQYAWVYVILVIAQVVFNIGRSVMCFYVIIIASKHLHNNMFAAIIRAPMKMFDTNPVGRILNRFAKDTGIIDELLPSTMADFINFFFSLIGVVIFICVLNPLVLVFTVPLTVVFLMVRMFYIETSRDIKRLEGTTRSPVFSHLSATLEGLHTVRAYRAQEQFRDIFDKHLDLHTQAWFLFLCTNRWLGIIADLISAAFIIGVAFTCVLAADIFSLDSSLVGVSMAYALTLLAAAQWCVRQSAEVENQMTSTERILEYVDIAPEAPLETDQDPAEDWPGNGRIVMKDASLRYSQDGIDVLKDISFSISSAEKIGIVGRTGAGKSSLTVALLRLAEPSGTITIDDVDITKIGLHPLRSKLSFIPQDPTLFSGTLRKNLDPFAEHIDNDLWKALDEVQLKTEIEGLELGLESKMAEGGTNFSVGQRQLMCLARAILRRNKILIVDEATANVDLRTDELIQTTIRQRFKKCTVLTIAHRLNTVMDSDRIMVLDNGNIAEFDTPYRLLQNEDGLLTNMVQKTGKTESAKLIQIAQLSQEGDSSEDIDINAVQLSGTDHVSDTSNSEGS